MPEAFEYLKNFIRGRYLVIGLLSALTFMRFYNLDVIYSYDYDEGVYLQIAKQVINGYKLYEDIFLSQPPYFIYIIVLSFRIFGVNLFAGRLSIALLSMFSAILVYALSKKLSGNPSALISLTLVLIDNTYLIFSRTVQAEVPSITFALLSIYFMILFYRARNFWYIFIAGIASSLSIGMKFFGITTLIPAVIILAATTMLFKQHTAINFLKGSVIFVIGLFVPLIPLLLFFDMETLYYQLFLFHLSKPSTSLADKVLYLARIFVLKKPYLSLLGILGFITGVTSKNVLKLSLIAWALSSALMLVFLPQPIWLHHITFLIPGLSVMSGFSIDIVKRHLSKKLSTRIRLNFRSIVTFLVFLVAALTFTGSLIMLIPEYQYHILRDDDETLLSAINEIKKVAASEKTIITDNQFLAFVANKNVPPELCDTSRMRIMSGSLTDQDIIYVINKYNISTVIFWSDRIINLSKFVEYVKEHYKLVRSFDDGKLIYHR